MLENLRIGLLRAGAESILNPSNIPMSPSIKMVVGTMRDDDTRLELTNKIIDAAAH
jgi:hypothetical protein